MAHADRKVREKEAVRNSILAAARKIASEQGWHALTIRKIADEIEYTAPIVYEHFENKETLIQEIVISGFRTLHSRFKEVYEKQGDAKDKIRNLSIIHWDFAFENPELYQLMFSLERKPHNEEMTAHWGAIHGIFTEFEHSQQASTELMFNWICLKNGMITIFMKMCDDDTAIRVLPPKKEVFINSIERFIKSIS